MFIHRRKISETREALFVAAQGSRGEAGHLKKLMRDMDQESR